MPASVQENSGIVIEESPQVLASDQSLAASATLAGRLQHGMKALQCINLSFDAASSLLSWNAATAVWKEQQGASTGVMAVLVVVILCVIVVMIRRRVLVPKREPTSLSHRRVRTSSSFDVTTNRPRSSSVDFSVASPRTRAGTDDGVALQLLKQDEASPATVLGPNVPSIIHETWTPPMPWVEASRQLMPQKGAKNRSKKQVILNIRDGTLTIQSAEAGTNSGKPLSMSMNDLSIHVKPPVEGAVLEIYRKNTPKEEWMEHTFQTAYDAAQFQHDMLAYQAFGVSVHNMYEALELVHKGSMAHDGKECVLHDCEAENTFAKRGAVAWDDAMRCFSSLDTVRHALHEMLAARRSIVGEEESIDDGLALMPDYVDKRHMLGHVDLFRLFVSVLPPSSCPHGESQPGRLEQLLSTRKIVAEAAALVKAYVRARVVTNNGWTLAEELPDGYFTRRLAFDEKSFNYERDSKAKNEYYEATVSRDVHCAVHSLKHLKKPGSSLMSQYQAYSLVGCHVFQLPPKEESHPLVHEKDPVQALPSLLRIIGSHPDLDFFVCAFFPEGLRICVVHLFVRSFPKGIDSKFDNILNRFANGSIELRRQKLEVFMQLGPGASLSPLAWAALKAVSMLLSWTRKGEAEIPFACGADRTPFPGMTLNNYTETRHFGGSLQNDSSLPENYLAVTSHVDVSQMSNFATRVLYQRLEEGALPASIVDFTFVLEGQQEDELPERAMASIRMVHVDVVKIALPVRFSAEQQLQERVEPAMAPLRREEETGPDIISDDREQDDDNPFSDGVNALSEILEGVAVPVRRENLTNDREDSSVPFTQPYTNFPPSVKQEDLRSVPVLHQMDKTDLKRFFVAAGCDLKNAAVRIVKSSAWRGVTFPIDTRECRVELQSGQFFQQGIDFSNNPVYYFQNLCLGAWRKDEDAVISAVLHRLENSLKGKPDVKCTIVIVTGKPLAKMKKARNQRKEAAVNNGGDEGTNGEIAADDADTKASASSEQTVSSIWNPLRMGANPRIDAGEDYHVHTNKALISRLVDLLLQHYPERLHRALILPGEHFLTLGVRAHVPSARTRSKVVLLNRVSELTQFISERELLTIVGGQASVDPRAFECI